MGFILGGSTTLAPMYIVELSPPELSGLYGSVGASGLIMGIILVDLIGEYFRPWACNVLAIVDSALFLLLLYFVPETSPKNGCMCSHELIKSKEEKIPDDIPDGTELSDEMNETLQQKNESIIKQPHLRNLIVCVAMYAFQQFCGANAIVNNLNSILAQGGIPLRPGAGAAIAMLAQVVSIIFGGTIVNLVGRKTMWFISCLVMFACEYVLAFNDEYKWNNVLPVVIMFILLLGYGLGLGSIPSYYVSEMFPDSIRSTAASIVNITQWSTSFIVLFIYEPMIQSMKFMGTFIFYGSVAFVSAIFGFLCLKDPENAKINNAQELKSNDDNL